MLCNSWWCVHGDFEVIVSENITVATIQCCITGDSDAHRFGSSCTNQRIESFWSVLRQLRMQWWIDLFEDLVACDLLDISNESHLEIVRFCFMNIIQSDIQVFANNWNTHRIRPSSTGVASGVPNELFFLPQPPYTDCALVVRPNDVNQFRHFVSRPQTCVMRKCWLRRLFDLLDGHLQCCNAWQLAGCNRLVH